MWSAVLFQDGSLPFARSIKDIPSEFRLLSKLTELLINHGEKEEALQYATLAVQVAGKTGTCQNDPQEKPCYLATITINTEVQALFVSAPGVQVNERTAYHRLATIYYILHQYEMAENYYLKSLSLCPPVLQHPGETRYYTKIYCRLGNLTLHNLKVGMLRFGAPISFTQGWKVCRNCITINAV